MELIKDCIEKFCSLYLQTKLCCKVHNEGFASRIKTKKIASNAFLKIGKRAHLNNVELCLSNSSNVYISSRARLRNVVLNIKGCNASVFIGSYCIINNTTFWIEDSDCSIVIGDNTFIGGAHIAVTGNKKRITIGRDSMLSDGIVIRTGDSHAIVDEVSGTKINPEQDVTIEDHVWIAQNATILKGSHISKDSIVGCNSVVSGQFEANSMIAGVTAKVVKTGITWSKDRLLD